MQIIDLSQIMLSAIFGSRRELDCTIEDLRGMMLAMIRNLNFKFRLKYGELVIACDGDGPYWRTQKFPYYKANRIKLREKDGMDWEAIRLVRTQFKNELRENFPYKMVEIKGIEADDIIAVLCHDAKERVMIISSDHDYQQLHDGGIEQYDPIREKYVKCENPEEYLVEHILKGDRGDGIPNVLSDDDTFMVEGKRQNVMTSSKFNMLKEHYFHFKMGEEPNVPFLKRNTELIDLSMIPEDISSKIKNTYLNLEKPTRSKMRHYFAEHDLVGFARRLGEF